MHIYQDVTKNMGDWSYYCYLFLYTVRINSTNWKFFCRIKFIENDQFVVGLNIIRNTYLYFFCHKISCNIAKLWEGVGTLKIRTSKGQNIKSFFRMIRTSKVKKINYLWRITYVYQGLWGVSLGSIRLG